MFNFTRFFSLFKTYLLLMLSSASALALSWLAVVALGFIASFFASAWRFSTKMFNALPQFFEFTRSLFGA